MMTETFTVRPAAATAYNPENWPDVVEWLINDCWDMPTPWEVWAYPVWSRRTYRYLTEKQDRCLRITVKRLAREGRVYAGR